MGAYRYACPEPSSAPVVDNFSFRVIYANPAFIDRQLALAARLVRHDDRLECRLQKRLVLRKSGAVNPGDRVLHHEPGILYRARESVPCARAAEGEEEAAGL